MSRLLLRQHHHRFRGTAAELAKTPAIAKLIRDRGKSHHRILSGHPAHVEHTDAQRLGKQLHDAAERGDYEQVALALRQGADINWRNVNSFNTTALFIACANGHEAVVQFLLESGAAIHVLGRKDQTPLHLAAKNGHQSIARLLIDRGASVNAVTKFNRTPLHYASQKGHESVARLLLERGASINPVDSHNCTPLYLAVMNGHESIVRLLLDRGADTSIVSVRQLSLKLPSSTLTHSSNHCYSGLFSAIC